MQNVILKVKISVDRCLSVMFRSIFTNSSGILTSRLLGFVRDMLTANALGASIYSDIFFVAFKIPNLFRNIFAEGAFSQSFIPTLAASKDKWLFSADVFIKLFSFIFLFSLVVAIFQNVAAEVFAFGYSQDIKDMAAPIIAINFYYLDLIFIVTFLGALLQYRKHFAVTAFATALLNVGIIGALLIFRNSAPMSIVYALSFGVLFGGLLQVLAHLYVAKKKRVLLGLYIGFKKRFSGDKSASDDSRRFNAGFLPSIAGSSTAQISAFIDTWLATFLGGGAISYLYYANRIFQLPLAVFAIATSVALFPAISRLVNNGRQNEALEKLGIAFWFLAFMLCAFSLGGIVLSHEVIWLIYQRGEFDANDTAATSAVLAMYMIGLIPFGLSRLFSLWLYAHHKQKTAAKNSMLSLGFNAIASIVLMNVFGAPGLALSGSLTGFLLLWLTLRHFDKKELFKIIWRPQFIAILLAALLIEALTLKYIQGFFI